MVVYELFRRSLRRSEPDPFGNPWSQTNRVEPRGRESQPASLPLSSSPLLLRSGPPLPAMLISDLINYPIYLHNYQQNEKENGIKLIESITFSWRGKWVNGNCGENLFGLTLLLCHELVS